MAQSLGQSVPDSGCIYQLHAFVLGDALPRIPAVNRDFIAPGGQALSDFFDGGLEPAMPRGHPRVPINATFTRPAYVAWGLTRPAASLGGVQVQPLSIDGVWEFTPLLRPDDRGVFLEAFKQGTFAEATGHAFDLQQMNISVSRSGTVRGIHFADVPRGRQSMCSACPVSSWMSSLIFVLAHQPLVLGMPSNSMTSNARGSISPKVWATHFVRCRIRQRLATFAPSRFRQLVSMECTHLTRR